MRRLHLMWRGALFAAIAVLGFWTATASGQSVPRLPTLTLPTVTLPTLPITISVPAPVPPPPPVTVTVPPLPVTVAVPPPPVTVHATAGRSATPACPSASGACSDAVRHAPVPALSRLRSHPPARPAHRQLLANRRIVSAFDLDACGQRGHARRAAAPAARRRRSRSGSRRRPESSSSCRAVGRTAAPPAASRSRAAVGGTGSASPASSVDGRLQPGRYRIIPIRIRGARPTGRHAVGVQVLSRGSVPARITTTCVRPTGTSTAASLTEEGAAGATAAGAKPPPKPRAFDA